MSDFKIGEIPGELWEVSLDDFAPLEDSMKFKIVDQNIEGPGICKYYLHTIFYSNTQHNGPISVGVHKKYKKLFSDKITNYVDSSHRSVASRNVDYPFLYDVIMAMSLRYKVMISQMLDTSNNIYLIDITQLARACNQLKIIPQKDESGGSYVDIGRLDYYIKDDGGSIIVKYNVDDSKKCLVCTRQITGFTEAGGGMFTTQDSVTIPTPEIVKFPVKPICTNGDDDSKLVWWPNELNHLSNSNFNEFHSYYITFMAELQNKEHQNNQNLTFGYYHLVQQYGHPHIHLSSTINNRTIMDEQTGRKLRVNPYQMTIIASIFDIWCGILIHGEWATKSPLADFPFPVQSSYNQMCEHRVFLNFWSFLLATSLSPYITCKLVDEHVRRDKRLLWTRFLDVIYEYEKTKMFTMIDEKLSRGKFPISADLYKMELLIAGLHFYKPKTTFSGLLYFGIKVDGTRSKARMENSVRAESIVDAVLSDDTDDVVPNLTLNNEERLERERADKLYKTFSGTINDVFKHHERDWSNSEAEDEEQLEYVPKFASNNANKTKVVQSGMTVTIENHQKDLMKRRKEHNPNFKDRFKPKQALEIINARATNDRPRNMINSSENLRRRENDLPIDRERPRPNFIDTTTNREYERKQ